MSFFKVSFVRRVVVVVAYENAARYRGQIFAERGFGFGVSAKTHIYEVGVRPLGHKRGIAAVGTDAQPP